MPSDLFDLSAKISANTSQYDKAISDSQKKIQALADQHKKLDSQASSAFRNITSQISSMQTPLSGVSSQLSTLASASGPIGMTIAGLVAVTTAAIGATYQIYQFATSVSESAGKIYDLSQQLNLSSDTLSGLSILAQQSGTSIEQLSAGLGIFQKKLEDGDKAFKTFGVTVTNTEQALRQALETLAKADPSKQVALSMEMFGRSGKSMLGVIKQANGDIDQAIKKFQQMGAVLDASAIKKADEFNDRMVEVNAQLEVVKTELGMAFLPTIIKVANEASDLIARNQSQIAAWATFISGAAEGAAIGLRIPLGVLRDITAALEYLASHRFVITYSIVSIGGIPFPIPSGVSSAPRADAGVEASLGAGIMRQRGFVGGGGGGGGRGGGGGGGRAKKEIDDVAEALAKQSQAIHEAWARTDQYQKTIDDLVRTLEKKKKALTDDQRTQLENNAATLRGIEMMHSYWDMLRESERAIRDAREGVDEYEKAIRAWEDSERAAGRATTDGMMAILRRNAEIRRTLDLTRQRIALEQTLTERLERQRYVEAGNLARSVGVDLSTGEETRRRRVLGPTEEQIAKVRQFAADLTTIIDDAIHTGFRDGMKAGLIEFAQGILRMIETKILDKLTDAIANAILGGINKGTAGGAGGGGGLRAGIGIVGGILGAIFGGGVPHGLGGVTAGAGGGIGSFASGIDYVPYDMFAKIHKGERVVPASENRPHSPNVNITVYAQDAQSFTSRDTQRQISEKYRRAMQRSALTA